MLHEHFELDQNQPFGHSARLLDTLMGFLNGQVLLMLQNVSLNQVPVLKLLSLDILLVPAFLDEHAARFCLFLLLAGQGYPARLLCLL